MQERVGLGSAASDSGKGKSKMSKHITHGFYLVKGKAFHAMEDYAVAQFKQVGDNELGLFAIFDGHLSHEIPDYLRSHLFDNIINEVLFHLCFALIHILIVETCFRYMTLICSYSYIMEVHPWNLQPKTSVDSFS